MFGWVRTGARAKATATSIARSVQARREEVHGSAASKTDDRVKWNATRNITRMLNRAGMAIEVPREILKYEIQDGSVIELPVVKPSSWLQLILKKYPELLFPQNNMEEELQVFWNHYRFIQPNHEIFKSPPEQLKRTLPILVHGDEGRYLKKGNYLIATIEMMLGSTPTKLKECCCEADPVLERYPEVHNDEGNIFSRRECEVASKQLVNLSGNCFLSKYLLFGMASQQYKAHPDLVHQAMGMVSEDLASLHSQGFRLGSEQYFCATLGVKGDLKFHFQMGHLTRTYLNTGTTNENPVCSLCLAGSPGFPFEDLGPLPRWQDTMFSEKPWNHEPVLVQIPFQHGQEEALFRFDCFHCWKLGVGRDLVGSTLVSLALLRYYDFDEDDTQNLPDRLDRCHSHFRLWCQASGKSPALHYFSQALFNSPNQRSFPWANVKGSDCMLLTSFLLFLVDVAIKNGSVKEGHLVFFKIIKETLQSVEVFFSILYSHGLWLSRKWVLHHVMVMLKGYKRLAHESAKLDLVAYSLKPKLHSMRHIAGDIENQLRSGAPKILNILAFSCEPNEDMVGHVARLSRRVSARTVNHRVFDRVCIRMKTLWKKKRKHSGIWTWPLHHDLKSRSSRVWRNWANVGSWGAERVMRGPRVDLTPFQSFIGKLQMVNFASRCPIWRNWTKILDH